MTILNLYILLMIGVILQFPVSDKPGLVFPEFAVWSPGLIEFVRPLQLPGILMVASLEKGRKDQKGENSFQVVHILV